MSVFKRWNGHEWIPVGPALQINGTSALPTVTDSDNGKLLTVVGGVWDKANLDIDTTLTSSGVAADALTVGQRLNATYSKPSTGIPASDLDAAVQSSLNAANTAYQKPVSGIPATDLEAGVIPVVTQEIFWATYGSTTAAEIEAALNAGKLVGVKKNSSSNTYICFLEGKEVSVTYTYYIFVGAGLTNFYVAFLQIVNQSGTESWFFNNKPTKPYPATELPQDLAAIPSVGSSVKYAKEDHIHKMPTYIQVGAVKNTWLETDIGKVLVVGSDKTVKAVTRQQWENGDY